MTRSWLSLFGLLLCAQLTSCQNLNSLNDLKPADFSVQLRPRSAPQSSSLPTLSPSSQPTSNMSVLPSVFPSVLTTDVKTITPIASVRPTPVPTLFPTLAPSSVSSSQTSLQAISAPAHTHHPITVFSTPQSTVEPAPTPIATPILTPEPTPIPTPDPSFVPTPVPTETPTSTPVPTPLPTSTPTLTLIPTPVSVVSPETSILDEILRLTNLERSSAGLSELTFNPLLNQAAQAHADTMVTTGQFSHVINDLGPSDRVTATGYRWRAVGENIALGYSTPLAVMTGWMNSSGHRANILSTNYTELGVGIAKNSSGRTYWVQVFGRPR